MFRRTGCFGVAPDVRNTLTTLISYTRYTFCPVIGSGRLPGEPASG